MTVIIWRDWFGKNRDTVLFTKVRGVVCRVAEVDHHEILLGIGLRSRVIANERSWCLFDSGEIS
jgi:hypothetical protein